jgi:mono/diheme cytochrome c family protein
MEYPVWELFGAGGGFLIALMATVHVYVAHFAVGGGLFLVMTEHKGLREKDPAILEYTKRHARFFMLLTLVVGGITGVGIWSVISVLSPAVTSTLIHGFVFGWATEWVCFFLEIMAILLYVHTFGRLASRAHLTLGWLYFIFAWLSLVLINGIVGFMLTPGRWLETQNFWHGFFNPSFWPGMVFRTALALVIAGVYGFFTASFLAQRELRERMLRWSARWLALPFAFMLLAAWWYFRAMPADVRALILGGSPEIPFFTQGLLWVAGALLVLGLVMAARLPAAVTRPLAVVMLVLGFLTISAFEWVREAGRRPFLIRGHTWSSAVKVADADRVNRDGVLATARWVQNRSATPANAHAAGREVWRLECMGCHSVGGPLNDILPLTAKFPVYGMDSFLDGLGKLEGYMPPFLGRTAERQALAAYIVEVLHGEAQAAPAPSVEKNLPVTVPPFDAAGDEYVLLAWNNLGMHCVSDGDPWWVLLPPANELWAQLVRRGPIPEIVTAGVEIRYAVEPGFERPQDHVRFWEFAPQNFGATLEPGIGLAGRGVQGTMELEVAHRAFSTSLIPVVPYQDDGFNPYPLFTVEARDTTTGELLARTRMVAPTSTEMGCRNCHGGAWRVGGVAGISDDTARDILAVHDRNEGTDLLAHAERGEPRLCQSCHPDPVLNTSGKPEILGFPAAMHGWHANHLTNRGAEACAKCHPNAPEGATRCLRGRHAGILDCTDCHGTLEDHALSLLRAEMAAGRTRAERLMTHLTPRTVPDVAAVNPRTPWLNEPDCLNCHEAWLRKPDRATSAFNTWTAGAAELYRLRHDEMGALMCEACHGSTHANYPAVNSYGRDRDNVQPLQYQGNREVIGAPNTCAVCHRRLMRTDGHHPNMIRRD